MIEKGNRYLLNKKTRGLRAIAFPEEHFIIEVSESGKYFKSRFNDEIKWYPIERYEVLEILPKEGQ